MKKMNPFFVIGTTGLIVTAALHIFMALVLNIPGVHPAFLAMYPAFAAFLTIGAVQLINSQKPAEVRVRANNRRN